MKKSADIYTPKTAATEPAEPTNEAANTDEKLQARREEIDKKVADMPTEYGGRPKDKGLEPTRYNDWEFKGRCIDF